MIFLHDLRNYLLDNIKTYLVKKKKIYIYIYRERDKIFFYIDKNFHQNMVLILLLKYMLINYYIFMNFYS